MTDLKSMSVDEILEDFNRFVSVHEPEYSHMKEMARRLREQEKRIKELEDSEGVAITEYKVMYIRAEQSEADLEQMTARCGVMALREAEILLHFSPEHLDKVSGSGCGTKLAEALSNLPASVEKLLAIKRAADAFEQRWYNPITKEPEWPTCDYTQTDLVRAVRANKEKPFIEYNDEVSHALWNTHGPDEDKP